MFIVQWNKMLFFLLFCRRRRIRKRVQPIRCQIVNEITRKKAVKNILFFSSMILYEFSFCHMHELHSFSLMCRLYEIRALMSVVARKLDPHRTTDDDINSVLHCISYLNPIRDCTENGYSCMHLFSYNLVLPALVYALLCQTDQAGKEKVEKKCSCVVMSDDGLCKRSKAHNLN